MIVAERLEDVLGDVAESRAIYLELVGQLAWLLKTHMIPTADARARQLVADANTPPSAWREAATAGTAAMEDALASLLADPEAPITCGSENCNRCERCTWDSRASRADLP